MVGSRARWAAAPTRRRVLTRVLGVIALLLSAVGIYGVVSQWVVRRLRELGIRAALGARQRQLVGLVLARGLRPVAMGTALGVVLVVAHGPALRAVLYGVAPGDPRTLAAVMVTLASVATAACLLPARHAVRSDPADVLRCE